MKKVLRTLVLAASISATETGFGYDAPQLISSSLLTTQPYAATGICVAMDNTQEDAWQGSGYLVNPRVVVTAAHVTFDDDTLSWSNYVAFAIGWNGGSTGLTSALVPMTGSVHMESYSIAKNKGDSQTAFNLDIAALYYTQAISDTTGNYTVRYNGTPSIAAEEWSAMLLGYPTDENYISESNIFKMFQTGPGNWLLEDAGSTTNPNEGTESDAYGILYAEYLAAGELISYAGNSGGPLFVYDEDDDRYTAVGIITANNLSDSTNPQILFRLIDENAQDVIGGATNLAGGAYFLKPSELIATGSASGNLLNWTVSSSRLDGWQIRRNDGNQWTIVETTVETTFTDTSAPTGITCNYEVRAFTNVSTTETNFGPWSAIASASRGGCNDTLAKGMGAPYVYVQSAGNAPFYANGSEVYSGKILNLNESSMTLTVCGPGTLNFDWSASCQGTYLNSSSVATISDSMSLYVDGTKKYEIYGNALYSTKSLTFNTAGNHTVEFLYAKNASLKGGNDRGMVRNVSYYGTSSTEAVQGGIVTAAGGRHRSSSWLGEYYDYGNNWVYSLELSNYAYFWPVTSTAWKNGYGQWLYLDENFGWVWGSANMWPWTWSTGKGWMCYTSNGWFWVCDDARYQQMGTGNVVYGD